MASGVIRFVSVHPGIELLAQGHTSEMQTMEEGMIPVSGIDGIVSCFGSDMDFIRRILEAAPRVPAVFASVGRVVAPLKGRRSAAIFCDHAAVADDMRAMHVLNVCRVCGMAVPEQIQIVGADNEEWICAHTSPTLTSVEPDFEGCGQRAAETLLRLMAAGPDSVPAEQTFGVRRIEQRMSTTDMHGSVNRAVRARKWLRDNCGESFEVRQVAAHLGCSTRMLQLSYKAVFGRTMHEDLIEMRLERARKLLADTDIPVLRIPERCGSDAPNHFQRLFKARSGITMLQWRRQAKGR